MRVAGHFDCLLVRHLFDDVTYVYDDVTYVYDDVTYGTLIVCWCGTCL